MLRNQVFEQTVTDHRPHRLCPRCDGTTAFALGSVRSTLPWFQCGDCRHVWPERTPRRTITVSYSPCPKCGGANSHSIGQSMAPPLDFRQCEDCGHLSAVDYALA